MLLKKQRQPTKQYRVVRRNSRSMSSTTGDKVRQRSGWTLVCVSIHLECWLNKVKVEIVTWTAVGVACQQQFSYKLVSKFWQWRPVWIQFAFDVHCVYANSICIQTESSVKRPLYMHVHVHVSMH